MYSKVRPTVHELRRAAMTIALPIGTAAVQIFYSNVIIPSVRSPTSLIIVLLLAGCTHGEGLLARADANLGERDFGSALGRYRDLADESCKPQGREPLCCAALRGQADALLGMNERQAALAALERQVQECPTDPEVRRKLYQAQHAGESEDPALTTVDLGADHVVTGLGDGEQLQWVAVFLDGEPLGHEPLSVHPGAHELTAEALLRAAGPGRGRPRDEVHLRARQDLMVAGGAPVTGEVPLRFVGRPDSSLADDLIALEMGPPAVTPTPPRPGPPDFDLRVAGADPLFPPELRHRGQGWKVPLRICVTPEGRVRSVALLSAAPARDPRVDAIIVEAVRRWRYGPYKVNGQRQGFCHLHAIDLAAE
jgi:TonB family protein